MFDHGREIGMVDHLRETGMFDGNNIEKDGTYRNSALILIFRARNGNKLRITME
jgi:hypothetical protein